VTVGRRARSIVYPNLSGRGQSGVDVPQHRHRCRRYRSTSGGHQRVLYSSPVDALVSPRLNAHVSAAVRSGFKYDCSSSRIGHLQPMLLLLLRPLLWLLVPAHQHQRHRLIDFGF